MKQYMNLIIALPMAVKWLFFTEMFYGFAMGIWGINLNFHLADQGFNDAGIGNIIAIGSFTTAACSLLTGRLCDRFGFKLGMVSGSLVRALGIIIMAAAPRHELIFLGQFLFSIGGAFIETSETPLIFSVAKEKDMHIVYNLSFSVYHLAMFSGDLAGGMMPGWMHEQFGGYGMSIVICGILFALMGLGRLFLPGSQAPAAEHKFSVRTMRQPIMMWFLIYGLLTSFMGSLILPFSLVNTIYRDNFHITDNMIGVLYSLSTLLSCIAFFIAPIVLERWSNTSIAYCVLSLNVVFFILLSFVGFNLFVLIWLCFSFLNSILLGAVEYHMIKAIPDRIRGTYSGLNISVNAIGTGMGASVSGFILTYFSYSSLLLLGAAAVVVQIFVYAFGCNKYLSLDSRYVLQAAA